MDHRIREAQKHVDPDLDLAFFVIDNKKTTVIKKKKFFLLLSFWRYIYIIFQKKSQNNRNQGFSYYFCLTIEGSGSIPLTNGSGSGRAKNMWIRWIRLWIQNREAQKHVDPDSDPEHCLWLMDPEPGGPKKCGSGALPWAWGAWACRQRPRGGGTRCWIPPRTTWAAAAAPSSLPPKKIQFIEDNTFLGGFFFLTIPVFICRPSDSTVPTDAEIEPRTVATGALAVRRSNHQARSHPHEARSHPLLG